MLYTPPPAYCLGCAVYDARYLNIWMRDLPFKLDKLTDLPQYVSKDAFQTFTDDRCGFDGILLTAASRTLFGMQWGILHIIIIVYRLDGNVRRYLYHKTRLVATNHFQATGVPCSLYIDDSHIVQLQVDHHFQSLVCKVLQGRTVIVRLGNSF